MRVTGERLRRNPCIVLRNTGALLGPLRPVRVLAARLPAFLRSWQLLLLNARQIPSAGLRPLCEIAGHCNIIDWLQHVVRQCVGPVGRGCGLIVPPSKPPFENGLRRYRDLGTISICVSYRNFDMRFFRVCPREPCPDRTSRGRQTLIRSRRAVRTTNANRPENYQCNRPHYYQ